MDNLGLIDAWKISDKSVLLVHWKYYIKIQLETRILW